MTSKDIESELEREPFVPFKLHLVSGKAMTIKYSNVAWLMQNSLLVLKNPKKGRAVAEGYDVVSFRNIERIELLDSKRSNGH